MKKGIGLIAVLATTSAAILLVLYFTRSADWKIENGVPPELQQQDLPAKGTAREPLRDIPDLYPGFSWGPLPESRFSLSANALRYNNRIASDKENRHRGLVSLSGHEWFFELHDISPEQSLAQEFLEYYRSELSQRGWTRRAETHGFEILATEGDSPRGKSNSYLRVQDDAVRLIKVYYSVDTQLTMQCPCYYTFQVFLSDIVSLDEILPRAVPRDWKP